MKKPNKIKKTNIKTHAERNMEKTKRNTKTNI